MSELLKAEACHGAATTLDHVPGRPNSCARCRFWGAQFHEKATERWQLCLQEPVGLAHCDYWCPAYERKAKPCQR
jgi:hypothetical protein